MRRTPGFFSKSRQRHRSAPSLRKPNPRRLWNGRSRRPTDLDPGSLQKVAIPYDRTGKASTRRVKERKDRAGEGGIGHALLQLLHCLEEFIGERDWLVDMPSPTFKNGIGEAGRPRASAWSGRTDLAGTISVARRDAGGLGLAEGCRQEISKSCLLFKSSSTSCAIS